MVTTIHCYIYDSSIETNLSFPQKSWPYSSALDASVAWNVLSAKHLLLQNSAQVSYSLSIYLVISYSFILLDLSFTHACCYENAYNTSLCLLPLDLSLLSVLQGRDHVLLTIVLSSALSFMSSIIWFTTSTYCLIAHFIGASLYSCCFGSLWFRVCIMIVFHNFIVNM